MCAYSYAVGTCLEGAPIRRYVLYVPLFLVQLGKCPVVPIQLNEAKPINLGAIFLAEYHFSWFLIMCTCLLATWECLLPDFRWWIPVELQLSVLLRI